VGEKSQPLKLLTREEFDRLSPQEKLSYLAAAILTIGQPRRDSFDGAVDPSTPAPPPLHPLDDKPK
jgi:hypothetical protein